MTGRGEPTGAVRVVRDRSEVPGEYSAVRVLGTVAQPARQTV